MPEPNRVRRFGGSTALDRRLKQEARAERRATLDSRPFGRLRRRLGWPLAALGVVMFAATYVGAASGANLLPFDRHHVIGQLGGAVLVVIGVGWATSGGTRRGKR